MADFCDFAEATQALAAGKLTAHQSRTYLRIAIVLSEFIGRKNNFLWNKWGTQNVRRMASRRSLLIGQLFARAQLANRSGCRPRIVRFQRAPHSCRIKANCPDRTLCRRYSRRNLFARSNSSRSSGVRRFSRKQASLCSSFNSARSTASVLVCAMSRHIE